MRENLYQAGDKVLVKNSLNMDDDYGMLCGDRRLDSVVSEMLEMRGKIVTIEKHSPDERYKIQELRWNWTDEMFEGKVIDIGSVGDINLGDKLIVRDDLHQGDDYGHYVNGNMKGHHGQVVTVREIALSGSLRLEEDTCDWVWSKDMFSHKLITTEQLLKDYGVSEEVKEAVKGLAVEKASIMKYKVGDKVRVKSDLSSHNEYHHENGLETRLSIDSQMVMLAGKTVTIESVDERDLDYRVSGSRYYWTVDMFEDEDTFEGSDDDTFDDDIELYFEEYSVVEEVKAKAKAEIETVNRMGAFGIYVEKVIYSDPATIVFYRVPEFENFTPSIKELGKLKKIVAKCSPEDTYSKENGFKVALLKAMIKEGQIKLNNM